MADIDPTVLSYSHLARLPRAQEALHQLKKVASLVKPIMRARGWKVKQLTEFYPEQQNLLGLNVNRGAKICLRLRYPADLHQFLPPEQVVDTMLHELAHIVHGPHNAKFQALWDQLRDEHESLAMKGYTGEGFLSEGHRLGGRRIPMEEARRLARNAAEKRRALNTGSGQRLGGAAPRPGQDIRRVIVDAVERRNRTLRGCANEEKSQDEIYEIAETATKNGFRTQAEEEAANEAAIAQALWELVQEEEKFKKGDAYMTPSPGASDHGGGGGDVAGSSLSSTRHPGSSRSQPVVPEMPEQPPGQQAAANRADRVAGKNRNDHQTRTDWSCEICTLRNPVQFLCCDACGTERGEKWDHNLDDRLVKRQRTTIDLTKPDESATPSRSSQSNPTAAASRPVASRDQTRQSTPTPPTWTCHFCGRVRERQWWSCDLCGSIKSESK
ncbi:WLM-domain-containing protein [Xylariomycetidae sp. FL0641]|nr:WLM-domain-containing protein [Xylariomycetidae sp. FL0641]